jgi:hypothetical protein
MNAGALFARLSDIVLECLQLEIRIEEDQPPPPPPPPRPGASPSSRISREPIVAGAQARG